MPKVTRQQKKKELERATKKSGTHKEKPAAKTYVDCQEEFRGFEEALTFKTFRAAFDVANKHLEGWRPGCLVSEILSNVGHKIRVPELKKILKFLTKGDDERRGKWRESVDAIIRRHHDDNNWLDISDARLECLLPYTDCSFWTSFFDFAPVLGANEMSVSEIRAVFDAVLIRRAT
jgi:hypothetical protein